jgi:hypothetical protein
MKLSWLIDIEPIWGLTDIERFVDLVSNAGQGHKVLVWHVLWENYTGQFDRLEHLVHRTRLLNPAIKIVLLADRWYQPDKEKFLKIGIDEMLVIDFFALATALRRDKFEQPFNEQWSKDREKFLFLTGKPDKPNRIRLLWKFDRAGLLDQAIWSLFVPPDVLASCQPLLPEISTLQLQEFVQKNSRSPDLTDDIPGLLSGSLHYCGFPFDVRMYEQSLFHVVSETLFDNQRPWITEKTWLALVNHLPFIMAGNTNTLLYLRQIYDLRTFENYLPRPDYDKIMQSDARLDAIVENSKYWLDHIADRFQEITEDIKHNHRRAMVIMQENQIMIESFLEQHDLSASWREVVENLDGTRIEQGMFYTWYENIRDPSWPDCFDANQWHDLPEKIKQECTEVFGYNPITKKDSI